jgi:hypothetical protein
MIGIVLLLTLCVGLRVVSTANRDKRISASTFLRFWLVAWIPIWLVLLNDMTSIVDQILVRSGGYSTALFLYYLVIIHPLTQRVIWRLNDVGMSHRAAYLSFIPYINLLLFIFLSTARGHHPSSES